MTDTNTDKGRADMGRQLRGDAERELKVEGVRELFTLIDEGDHAQAKARAARLVGAALADMALAARSFARMAEAAEDAAASLRVIGDEMQRARAFRERERRGGRS